MNISDVTKNILTDVEYPATKKEIVGMAEKGNAPEEDMKMLKKLPEKEYSDMNEVIVELGKMEM